MTANYLLAKLLCYETLDVFAQKVKNLEFDRSSYVRSAVAIKEFYFTVTARQFIYVDPGQTELIDSIILASGETFDERAGVIGTPKGMRCTINVFETIYNSMKLALEVRWFTSRGRLYDKIQLSARSNADPFNFVMFLPYSLLHFCLLPLLPPPSLSLHLSLSLSYLSSRLNTSSCSSLHPNSSRCNSMRAEGRGDLSSLVRRPEI